MAEKTAAGRSKSVPKAESRNDDKDDKKGDKKDKVEETMGKTAAKMLTCVVGIWGCYGYLGIAHEGIFKFKSADGEKFSQTTALLVVEHLIAAFVATVIVFVFRQTTNPDWSRFFKPQGIVAVAQGGAKFFGSESLKYVSYPIQALFKSSKTLPAMVGAMVSGKPISVLQWIAAVAICAGTAGFSLMGKKGGSGGLEASAFGVALLLGALVCDGAVSMSQEGIRKTPNPINAYEQMLMTNLGVGLLTLPFALATGQVASAIAFVGANPALQKAVVSYSVCSAFGQIFIFMTISWFGPDTNAKITTIRKMGSVLGSIIWYGHHVEMKQWGCIVVVFAAVLAELAEKMFKGGHKAEAKKTAPSNEPLPTNSDK